MERGTLILPMSENSSATRQIRDIDNTHSEEQQKTMASAFKRLFSPTAEPSLKSILALQVAAISAGPPEELVESNPKQAFKAEIERLNRLEEQLTKKETTPAP